MPTASEWAFVALGSNVGDRAGCLAFGRARLAVLPHTRVVAVSEIEETDPVGPVSQPPFLNQMVLVLTGLSPRELLEHCQRIEDDAGRERDRRWGPRTLDLDLVRFGDRRIEEPDLRVPHPEIPNRPFWQRELTELAPYVAERDEAGHE